MSRVAALQDRLLGLLGGSIDGRDALVGAMLRRTPSEETSYWLQLLVSVGIATLGLVVGSTAVVIGAMLIAPLMGPIVGLAMGLATGSPFLVLRSTGRLALSVAAAVGGAAVMTALLPFHEVNAEIAARTSPTALDLLTAAFCALAGVYATIRPSTDTTATAAGTSIGISLVPPLCASGYGVGTLGWSVAGGAALLFLTNTVAIVVVGTVAFVAAGFNRVDVGTIEGGELSSHGNDAKIARALARPLAHVFASRWGSPLRFLMPFILLAVVYVPLRRALNEVAWEVRVRAAIRDTIAPEPQRVVQSRARVEHHGVELVVVIIGTADDAEAARSRMDTEIRQIAGVVPRVEVMAVADAEHLQSDVPPVGEALAPPTPEQQLSRVQAQIRASVERAWPSTSAGLPLVVEIGTADTGPLRLRVVHLGSALAADATETVERSVGGDVGRQVTLIDVAVPPEELTRADGDLAFVARVASAARATAAVAAVKVCVVEPSRAPREDAGASPGDGELDRAIDDALAVHPRVSTSPGEAWTVRFVTGSCPTSDGGAPDAEAPETGP